MKCQYVVVKDNSILSFERDHHIVHNFFLGSHKILNGFLSFIKFILFTNFFINKILFLRLKEPIIFVK